MSNHDSSPSDPGYTASDSAARKTVPPPSGQHETILPGSHDSVAENAPQGGPPDAAFGRYQLIECLGQGAMGAVYKAHDSQLDRVVAIKIPKFDTAAGPDLLERFYREARSAATLTHVGICPVHDVGEIDGTHYISMGYIEGKPLSAYIKPDKPISAKKTAAIVRRMAVALDEAHQRGVVHRDLKPDNVMIDRKSNPVIMDFGLARRSAADGDSRMTQGGQMIGTPAYMSPEQVDGDVELMGPRSDIYSLGVILYEMLTTRVPYEGSIARVLAQVIHGNPQRPSEIRPDVNSELEAICLKMMAPSPDDRHASMGDVVKDLAAFLKGQPISATESVLGAPSPTVESPQQVPDFADAEAEYSAEPPHRKQRGPSVGKSATPAIPRWAIWTGAGLLGFVLLFSLTLILKVGDATVRLEIDDPKATVFVDGDQVRIENLGATIELAPGDHGVEVKRGDVVVHTDKFTVLRDNNPVLTLQVLKDTTPAADGTSATVSTTGRPDTAIPDSAESRDPGYLVVHPITPESEGKLVSMRLRDDGTVKPPHKSAVIPSYDSNVWYDLAAHPLKPIVYLMDGRGPVRGFAVANDGSLSELPGSPFASRRETQTLTLTPDGRFAYAFDRPWRDDGWRAPWPLTGYRVEDDGRLTLLDDVLPDMGTERYIRRIVVHPSNRFLYIITGQKEDTATTTRDRSLYAFRIESTGRLTPLPGFPVCPCPNGMLSHANARMVMGPKGEFLVVTGRTEASTYTWWLLAHRIDPSNGSLSLQTDNPIEVAGDGYFQFRTHPNGFVYVYPGLGRSIVGFTLDGDTDQLRRIPDLNVPTPKFIRNYGVSRDGRFFCLGERDSQQLQVHHVSPNGQLSELKLYDAPVGTGVFVRIGATPESPPSVPVSNAVVLKTRDVIQELAAKGEPKGIGEGVTVFPGARGNGRSGAWCLNVPLQPGEIAGGTEWQFEFRTGGSSRGLHVIHPWRNGQLVVFMYRDWIAVNPVGEKRDNYMPQSTPSVEETPAWDDIFPLKSGSPYQVKSRLYPDGRYVLEMNGEVVATSSIDTVTPFKLNEKFNHAKAIREWQPGMAGLMVGPRDSSGVNSVTGVKLSGLANTRP